MGLITGQLGRVLGGGLGEMAGTMFGGKAGAKIGGQVGSILGGAAGSALPFKKGGMVKPKHGKKTQKAILHEGELVVPKSQVKNVPKKVKDAIKRGGGRDM